MMSAVVYDVGYDTKMIKKKENMVTVRLLAAIKETKTLQNINRPKISSFRSKMPYLSFEYHNLRHTIQLTISMGSTVSNFF